MATPEQIYAVYQSLAANAATVKEFQLARGDRVSGTVNLLLEGDRAKLLRRWGEEMQELGGVLSGTHADPYILEATQCFYWASLYAVTGDTAWEELDMPGLRHRAVCEATLEDPGLVVAHAQRLAEQPVERVQPAKLFLFWWAMDNHYRHSPRFTQTWSIEEMMEYDLQDMKKRDYLQPILRELGLVGEAGTAG